MNKAIFFTTTLLTVSAPSLAEGIFLDDVAKDYNLEESNTWESSPYALDTTPKHDAFTDDKCTRGTEEQFTSLADANKKKNVECYITHFPNSNIKTRMQSNDDGDVSVGFSWDFD
ncbi:hypothetical protein [Vibrio harveyi]|jgi:hypothetical protein|uniref:hypothetical protein n=1 Tax=Vibrio harveyi TaxID=669 RepID=UPI00165D455F|nr:hypothetical protein [Vibrio harveyi]